MEFDRRDKQWFDDGEEIDGELYNQKGQLVMERSPACYEREIRDLRQEGEERRTELQRQFDQMKDHADFQTRAKDELRVDLAKALEEKDALANQLAALKRGCGTLVEAAQYAQLWICQIDGATSEEEAVNMAFGPAKSSALRQLGDALQGVEL